jgi:SAM-dependent methyltransferase
MSDRCSQVLEEVHREILAIVRRTAAPSSVASPRLLDVGCWDGGATLRYAAAMRAAAFGIEIFDGPATQARARGIEVAGLDLETGAFPWPDACMDLVIANQVFEHLKNVWRPMSEMFRVLAPGGTLVLSVPNLASLHNRVMLALGLQPTSIRTRGPHVRGFTAREIRSFVALGGALGAIRLSGVGFYPFPARWSGPLAALWPGGSHTVIAAGVKRGSGANPWRDVLQSEQNAELQTYFA